MMSCVIACPALLAQQCARSPALRPCVIARAGLREVMCTDAEGMQHLTTTLTLHTTTCHTSSPISPSHHLPISPSPHLPFSPSLHHPRATHQQGACITSSPFSKSPRCLLSPLFLHSLFLSLILTNTIRHLALYHMLEAMIQVKRLGDLPTYLFTS